MRDNLREKSMNSKTFMTPPFATTHLNRCKNMCIGFQSPNIYDFLYVCNESKGVYTVLFCLFIKQLLTCQVSSVCSRRWRWRLRYLFFSMRLLSGNFLNLTFYVMHKNNQNRPINGWNIVHCEWPSTKHI